MSELSGGKPRRRERRRRRTGTTAITALVTSAAVALLGWVGPSYASTGPAGAKPTASATSAAPQHKVEAAPAKKPLPAATSPAASKPSAQSRSTSAPSTSGPSTSAPSTSGPSTSGPSTSAPSTSGPSTSAPSTSRAPNSATSAAKAKSLRAKAAAHALASASAKDAQATACGGPLAFDTVHACASITDGGSDTYTLTTGHADDLLTVQLTQTGQGAVTATLTGPDGTDTGCQITGWFGPAECPTGAAGTYTLVVSDAYDTSGYSLSVSSLQSSPCTTLTAAQLPFGAPALTGSLAAGGASACYAPAGGGSGDLLRVGGLPDGLRATVYDAHSTDVCYLQPGQDTCAVTGTGPYRVILRDLYAEAVTYEVNLNRVSYPAGCTTLAAAPFGDPGQAVVSGTLPVGGAECRSVTLPDGPARVSLQGGGSTNGSAAWTLYTSDGQQVCAGRDDVTCDSLPGAGTYTLLLENTSPFDAADYTAAVIPLTGTDGCAASVGTSYDLPLLHRTLTSPVQVDCQPFSGSAGDRIDLTGQLITTIVGPAGTAGCSRDTDDGSTQDGCVLTGTGPYRAISYGEYDQTGPYTMRIARLSDPAGCTPLTPQVYGTTPVSSHNPCWLLQVPAAGTYDVGGTQVYHQDGTRFCADGAESCAFPAAGTYAMVFRPDFLDDTPFVPVFVSPVQPRGCVAGASDTGFTSDPVSFDLTAAGQRDCLVLPTPSGKGLYLVAAPSATGNHPVETVYDAKGVQQCRSEYAFDVCKLTGTAPFHIAVRATVPGVYGLTVQRTGAAAGCAAWPQSSFGGSTGTPFQLTAQRQTVCLALPANGHSTAEMFDYTNTTNKVNASVRVYDAAGNEVCDTVGSSATTCRFTAGVGYTAVLVGAGTADTYHLVRRDVSSTATCAAPASLAIGGQSTDYSFTSALDSRCLRVQAPATDKLWLSVRTPDAAANSGAELLVVDSTGTIVCWQQGASCRVTGSASYVAIVLAAGYAGTPIAAHVDTWRIGTAAGWVPQCTANSLSPDGFGPRSGSLTQSSAAFCGVMQVKPGQFFDIYGTESDPVTQPALGIYSNAGWNGTGLDYPYQCAGVGTFHFECSVSGNAAATQVVLVLSPGNTRLPVRYAVQGVCRSQCSTGPKAADVTSVSPASGPADGRNKVVIHGSNLTLGTEVDLAQNADRPADDPMSTPVSVSADGTSLTVLLNTYEVPVGTYDVVLDLAGYSTGTRSPGYLPGGYTVTAPNPPSKGGGPAHITDPVWVAAHRPKA
jgi:hypothetical protein